MRIGIRETVVVRHPATAMDLHGPVDDLAGHVWRKHLDHRDFLLRDLVAGDVHFPGRVQHHEARRVDHDARLRDPLARNTLLGHGAAERHARGGSLAHFLERALGLADEAHAVVDAARSEPALGDLKTAALAQQDARGRHFHVLELDLHVAMRRVVVAEDIQMAQDLDARRARGHQDHRLLAVARRVVGIGLAHEDVDLASRIAGARGPPLDAVDDVVVALALDAALDVRRVRTRHRRLGHQEGRADLAAQERVEPLALVVLSAVTLDGFHIAGIRRRAVEHLRRPCDAAHDLAQRRVLQVRQALGHPLGVRQEKVPQARCARLGLQLLDDRHRLPALVAAHVRVVLGLVRVDVLVHERDKPFAQFLNFWRVLEIHCLLLCGAAASLQYLFHLQPSKFGQQGRFRSGFDRMGARGGPVHHALGDALRDARDAEQVVGHVEIPR